MNYLSLEPSNPWRHLWDSVFTIIGYKAHLSFPWFLLNFPSYFCHKSHYLTQKPLGFCFFVYLMWHSLQIGYKLGKKVSVNLSFRSMLIAIKILANNLKCNMIWIFLKESSKGSHVEICWRSTGKEGRLAGPQWVSGLVLIGEGREPGLLPSPYFLPGDSLKIAVLYSYTHITKNAPQSP